MASTKKLCSSILFLFVAFAIHQYSDAYQFNVGGRVGWVANPPEPYSTWAGRTRFQVNDTLLFRYNQGSNSVLEVNGNDYSQCNINNPITKMEDGNSIFTFNRTGPFYFISGNKTLCDQGQKLIIVVLALRNGPPPAPVAPATSPALSPASSPAISPATSPAPSPGIVTPPAAPSPGSSGTDSPPTPPSSGDGSPPGTPSTPGSETPPAGGNSSEASFTATNALMSAVTIILCLCMTLSG